MVNGLDAAGGLTGVLGLPGLAQPAGWVAPGGVPSSAAAAAGSARSAQAVKDFESLFVETLLQQAGLARTLDSEGGAEGGVVGELFVREIARSLSGQLHLGFARELEASK